MDDTHSLISTNYDIGKPLLFSPLRSGNIHATYHIQTPQGDFILQKLHPELRDDAFGKDMLAVTEHLAEQKMQTLELIKNRAGDVHTKDEDSVWRLYRYIAGDVFTELPSIEYATEAGAMLARFHFALEDLKTPMRKPLKLHESEKEHAKLMGAVHQHAEAAAEILDECKFVLEEMPKYFLSKNLPQTIIHGDPKISNFVFRDGCAHTMIDLDTCILHTPLADLGDAMRSWCGGREDDPNNTFSLEVFRAAWKGYAREGRLGEHEQRSVPQATALITLELAARFLRDAIEDIYFGWDAERYTTRREHNIARAKGQLALFHDLKKKLFVY